MKRLAPLVLLAICSACSATLPIRYEPTSVPRPLVGAEKAPLYLESVEDLVGGIRPVATRMVVKTERPLDEIVREALVTELTRLGFPLTRSPSEAKGVARAEISGATLEWPGGSPVIFRASLRIALRVRAGDRPLWDGETQANAEVPKYLGGGFAGDAPRKVFQMALDQAMVKLGTLLERESVPQLVAAGVSTPIQHAVESPKPVAARPISDVDDLPEAAASNPKAHAIAIGIERYREALPRADFAADDARLFAEYAKRVLGVPEDGVALLLDDRATRGDFVKYLERWLPNRVAAGDEVYIYFSGHGAPEPKSSDAYLVPFDGDPAYLSETGYSLKHFYSQLGKLPAAKVTVVMDSCFSGAGGRSVVASGARPLVQVKGPEIPGKLTVISASSGEQISNSYKEKGHGLFTYFFLKGLKDKGSDLKAVFTYLGPEVSAIARRLNNADQTPQWGEGK